MPEKQTALGFDLKETHIDITGELNAEVANGHYIRTLPQYAIATEYSDHGKRLTMVLQSARLTVSKCALGIKSTGEHII